jgi:hypothetical protein
MNVKSNVVRKITKNVSAQYVRAKFQDTFPLLLARSYDKNNWQLHLFLGSTRSFHLDVFIS